MVNYCEIDPHASKCYSVIHDISEQKNLWDVTTISTHKFSHIDLITHGSPCQDFSSAGKQLGGEKDSGTRSSLLWETLKVVRNTMPKYVVWENVKNVLSKKHKPVLDDYLKELEVYGYNNYMPPKGVLNAKDYGIPQNRERVFVVSIRQDIDKQGFKFPPPTKLTKDLSHYLYFRTKDDITENFYKRYIEQKGYISMDGFIQYINDLPISRGIGTKKMGLYDFNEMDTITTTNGLTGTLTCRNVQNYNKKFLYQNRLYKPSPKMCFMLMGFDETDFEKVKNIGTDSDLWDRAGNSIVVNVVQAIFQILLKEYIIQKPINNTNKIQGGYNIEVV